MQQKKIVVSIGIVALVTAIALSAIGVWTAVAATAVEPKMNYQGRLLDSTGNPVDGIVTMNFSLYNVPTGGMALGSDNKTVQVVNGLFNTNLSYLDVGDFDQALWLEIVVEGDMLSPRQQLLGAPYAFSLVPGAVVSGSLGSPLLTVNNSLGDGVRGISGSGIGGFFDGYYGVWGNGSGYGVIGTGVYNGGYFRGDEGDGVRAYSYGSDTTDDGVYARSNEGRGVYGYSYNGTGVYGYSTNSHGVYGDGGSNWGNYGGYFDGWSGVYGNGYYGVYGNGSYEGVYGRGIASGGHFYSDSGEGVTAFSYSPYDYDEGVYAYSREGSGVYGGSYNNTGLYGYSTNNHGVYGDAPGWGNYGGYFDGWSGVYGNGYYGVYGNGSYGLRARGYGDDGVWATSYGPSSSSDGVYAYSSNGRGVYGYSANNIGVQGRGGSGIGDYGGYFTSGGYRGLYAESASSSWYDAYFGGELGIYVRGDIDKGGTCNFVMDHPGDPSMEIVYVCLEGDEVGTYTRGSARLTNGVATVQLPDHFSLVTNSVGITVQVTPTADCNGLYVAEKSNSTIVVKELNGGTSGATFDYLVNGIRKGYEDHQPVREMKADNREPGRAPEDAKQEEQSLAPPEPPSISPEPEEEEPAPPPDPNPVPEPEDKEPAPPERSIP